MPLGAFRARESMLDQLLLDDGQVGAHRFLRRLGIALADRSRNLPVGGGIPRLIVDAMRGLAAMAPRAAE